MSKEVARKAGSTCAVQRLSWLLGATAGLRGTAALLEELRAAMATPPKDYASESTRSFFATIALVGGVDANPATYPTGTGFVDPGFR